MSQTTTSLNYGELTTEEADSLIQETIYADRVEDYEFNDETGDHLYFLDDGTVVTVNVGGVTTSTDADDATSDTTAPFTVEQADAVIQNSEYADLVEDYELDDETGAHLFFLEDGSCISVTAAGLHPVVEA